MSRYGECFETFREHSPHIFSWEVHNWIKISVSLAEILAILAGILVTLAESSESTENSRYRQNDGINAATTASETVKIARAPGYTFFRLRTTTRMLENKTRLRCIAPLSEESLKVRGVRGEGIPGMFANRKQR